MQDAAEAEVVEVAHVAAPQAVEVVVEVEDQVETTRSKLRDGKRVSDVVMVAKLEGAEVAALVVGLPTEAAVEVDMDLNWAVLTAMKPKVSLVQ